MKPNEPYHRVLAIMFSAFAVFSLGSLAHAYSVYRGVQANAVTGAVTWTNVSFGVSGNPPSLSFFYFPNDIAATAAANAPGNPGISGAQCLVRVDLPATVAPVPGATDNVGNAGIAVGGAPLDQPQPFPWVITFNNIPPGHWEILRPQISTAGTNAAASRVAASGFHNLAIAPVAGAFVINGTLGNCQP